jgi:hypothetical protein
MSLAIMRCALATVLTLTVSACSAQAPNETVQKRETFAESRKQLEQWLSRTRNIKSSTRVQNIKLQADRMVVYIRGELHDELHDERLGWVPQNVKTSGRHVGKKGWPVETRFLEVIARRHCS